MAFIRLVIFGFIALSLIYLALSWYSRSVRLERLEKRWAEENLDSEDMNARQAYLDEGMAKYNSGLRPKLLLLVYVVPTITVATIWFITNTN